jgi:hypothetical protein
MEKIEHLVYSREVIEFAAVSNEYCNILERVESYDGLKLLKIEQKLLPLLYYKTMMIPVFDSLSDDTGEKFVTEDDWNRIELSIKRALGEANDYLEVAEDGLDTGESIVVLSIAENLTDIYQDLKDFLVLYNIGTIEIMNDALWECLESFRLHWGQKIVSAIRAVHNVLQFPERIKEVSEDRPDAEKGVDTTDWILSKRQQQYRDSEDE